MMVNIDAITGRLSLLYLAENLQPMAQREADPNDTSEAREVRYLLPPFTVSSQWWRLLEDDGVFSQRLEIIAPDGKRTPIGDSVEFRMDTDYHRVFQPVQIAARLTGVSWLVLSLRSGTDEWEERGRYPIALEEIPKEPAVLPSAIDGGDLARPSAPLVGLDSSGKEG